MSIKDILHIIVITEIGIFRVVVIMREVVLGRTKISYMMKRHYKIQQLAILKLKKNSLNEVQFMKCECAYCKNNNDFDIPSDIIESLENGNLVLFCGGGISTESKIVFPNSFYETICYELDEKPIYSFSNLMSRFCELPNGRKKLIKRIRDRFNYIKSFREIYDSATRFHRELSKFYMIDTIVTTNWDDYFEEQCRAVPIVTEEDLALWDSSYRNVLKIHGSVNSIGTIIATDEDYERCYNELSENLIGGKLKDILATKTVVFIGYSFGDEDLNKILQFVKDKMQSYTPHLFIVTIDKNLNEKVDYPSKSIIHTDGTFFLHKLNNYLVGKKYINTLQGEEVIERKYSELVTAHSLISDMEIEKFPNNLYTLFYQDGMIHAFERFLEMRNSGIYYRPGYIYNVSSGYKEKIKDYHDKKTYFDEMYFEGYLSGLVALLMNEDELNGLPFYCKPPDEFFVELTDYLESIQNNIESEYSDYAKKFVDEHNFEGLVWHHTPYG